MRQFWRVVKRSESFRRSCEQSAGYRCEQLINHFPSRAHCWPRDNGDLLSRCPTGVVYANAGQAGINLWGIRPFSSVDYGSRRGPDRHA